MLRVVQNNVHSIDEARRRKRKLYFAKYEARLSEFIAAFVQDNFVIDFDKFQQEYIEKRQACSEESWNPTDLRADLECAIRIVYGKALWQEIKEQRWFDQRMLSLDCIVDRCVSHFILESQSYVNAIDLSSR